MTDWEMNRRIEENIRRIAAEKAAGTYVSPPKKSKSAGDDEEEEGQMERQRRLARERRLAEKAAAPPTPPSNPFAMPPGYVEKRVYTKPGAGALGKKIGRSPLAKRRLELASRWRICDVSGCGINTDGMSSLCRQHKNNRATYGHVKVRSRLRQKDYLHLIAAALKFFKKAPPPQPILEYVQSFLTPPGKLTGRDKGQKTRAMLIAELCRWADPRYRKKATNRPGYASGKAGYAPRDYLAVMVALEAFIAAREGHGFPGDTEAVEKAYALVRLHHLPGRIGVSKARAEAAPPGIVKGVKYQQTPNGTVLRAISARLRSFDSLGLYIHMTAQEVLKIPRKVRKAKNVYIPAKPVVTAPPAPAPRQEKLTRQIKITLPPRYKKPTIGRIATRAEVYEWQRNEELWRRCPQGYYHETQEITTE